MTGLKIMACVAIVLILIGQLRLGGSVKYSSDGLYVRLRLGALPFQIYPLKKGKKDKVTKPKKKEPKLSQKETEPENPEEEKGGSLQGIKQYLSIACEAAGELKHKIRIDRLDILFTMASEDAASAALGFGYANMVLGMLWPLFEQNFEVKEHELRVSVDFDTDTPVIYLYGALSMKLGQLISFSLRYGWKLLKVYTKTKKVQTKPIKNQKEAI